MSNKLDYKARSRSPLHRKITEACTACHEQLGSLTLLTCVGTSLQTGDEACNFDVLHYYHDTELNDI